MKHINHNKACTIAFKATGDIPGFHDLIEVALIPMHGLEPDRSIMPFNMRLQPQRQHTIGKSLTRAELINALEARPPWDVVELFERWYARLELRTRKRIIPVGYELHKLWGFLMDIFTWSPTGENFVEDFFDFSQARSLETITHYWNDAAWRVSEPYPFQKHMATYTAFRLGFAYEQRRTVLSTAQMYGEIWKRAATVKLPTGVPLTINYPKEIDYSVYDSQGEETED